MPAPNDPAPVSGPGALSRRTDGGPAQKLRALPDAKYGEQATYQQDQRGAPMAQSPSVPQGQPMQPSPAAAGAVPFSAPTQRPTEPVTSGASLGHGPGPEALGIDPTQILRGDADKMSKWLPVLNFAANQPDSLPGARLFVNTIKANMSAGNQTTQGPGAPPAPMPTTGGGNT